MHKVAIVGLGGAGLGHLRYWQQNNVEIAGLCDVQEPLIQQRVSQFGLERAYRTTDYQDLLRNCDCDIVAICTPDHVHAEQALAALETGRHVHLEKPAVTTRAELSSLLEASRQSKTMIGLHYQLRFFWLYRRIKELIDRGELGEVFAVETDYIHNLKIRDIGTSNWREKSDTVQPIFAGVGGTHFVDIIRWFTGDEVVSVTALGNRKAWSEYPADTHVTVLLKFRRGAVGKITVSIGSALPKQHPTKVFGTKACVDDFFLFDSPHIARPKWLGTRFGAISRGRIRGPLTGLLTYLLQHLPIRLEHYPFSTYEHVESCSATVRNFVRAIDGVETLEGSLTEAAKTFCVCEAVEQALTTGSVVPVNYDIVTEASR